MRSSDSESSRSSSSDPDILDKKKVLLKADKKKKKKSQNKDKKKKDQDKLPKKLKKDVKKDKKKKDKKQKKPKWGKYGIINMSDFHHRREEFMLWLSEEKHVNIEKMTQQEQRKYFEEYVECYNTATLPSEKYYNFKMWHNKEKAKGSDFKEYEMTVFDDEKEKRRELYEQKEREKNQRIAEQYLSFHEDVSQAAEMIQKQQMEELMRHQYLVGNHEAALQIKKQLQPKRTVIISSESSSPEY